MESRYYLFPGQTLENTKISDRAHALHITSSEWKKIGKHLDRKKDLQELLDKEESKRRYLAEGNKKMTENWDNTTDKIRKRKDETRAKTSEEIQAEKLQKYYVMREEQEKLRKEYIDNVRKKMFRGSGICNDLNSAFIESEVLYEREKQKEFKEFLKKHETEEDQKFAKLIKENALKEIEENKEKAQQLLEKNKKYGTYLQQVIEEKEQKEKELKEKTILKESEDNIKAVEEMELMKKQEEEQKAKYKKEVAAEVNKFLKGRIELQKQLKQEEKEMDEVVEIYKEAKHRIDCLKKEKEKELQESIIKRREVVANLVSQAEKSKTEAEDQQIKAAIAERDAMEDAKNKAKAEFEEKMKNERLEDRQNYLKRKEIEEKKAAEVRKWEMLNKYKVDEVTKEYEKQKKKEEWQNILKYRQKLLDQMDDVKEERKRLEQFECSETSNIKEQDDRFFEYADEIIEYEKKRGRSTYPVEKAILQYKKINNIHSKDVGCDNDEDAKKSLSKKVILKNQKSRPCRCTIRKK